MIIGDFRKWPEEKWLCSERLAQHLDYLYTCSFDKIEDGVYPVGEDGTYLVVKTTATIPFSEALPERHQRYMDIHYILAGSETIGVARDCEKNQPVEVSPAIDDHTFFNAVEHEMVLTLYPGQYAIFLPLDVHRPWCKSNEADYVRKALLKVPIFVI
ncbi:YhcH/YjgK/YiaL family protein [Paenibacillus sp. LjRoot153]|uniref:YhcH/YjgK/YiaL family protein n=1 Tax=Paenibacillus sp. LjRoot153 TaxID=3342270 RepID=UPI003ECFC741